ncbi:hydroxymethylglutaryl-coenzyme A synthase C terminal-domain-containing protein [Lipomyces chichibuensis]|uniref:hydroxymethylglutaryl-coenzyme A synthase C terminal-domain-containing protein n=1 Tax=Lipomyces chichibuensis TaxID=1546026 RepID=UPI003342EAC8
MTRPTDIGIKAIEIYIPGQYVEQAELEKYDGVAAGKYTIGLGQTQMAFPDDREDIYSMALTVLSSLIKKYNIDTMNVGRLEVGTETLLDKSKSVKSVLMQLFGDNTDIEGIDTVNACYGGTNAIFNSINWIESSAWDGRDAIVVAGDIALYAKGNARPTGGAGAVAILIGPNAPIVFDSVRGSYMQHAYDFYKPDFTSEYPYVDGHFSLTCYTRALDSAYQTYTKKTAKKNLLQLNGHVPTGIDRFAYAIFHSPTCKLVTKSFARLLYNDYLLSPDTVDFEVPEDIKAIDYEKSLTDKNVEKFFLALAKKKTQERLAPSMTGPTMCGNMYTASVYSGLVSLLSNVEPEKLLNTRVAAFSYGSGLASSFFSFVVKGDTSEIREKLNFLERLEKRKALSPADYEHFIELREKAHLAKDYTPEGSIENLVPGTYYLTKIDNMYRREYAIKQ